MSNKINEDWDLIIGGKESRFNLHLTELWKYKDLVLLFVRRDFIANYKQTVLGPLWHIIQPVITTLTFTVIFGNIAGLSTDGTPTILFYLSGIILWNYFSTGLNKTSNTFISNAHIFGKVYFPRLSVPISVVLSNMLSLGIQLLTLAGFLVYFVVFEDYSFQGNLLILLTPFLVLLMAMMSLGAGIIVSSLTTKYRDITFLIGFAVQLMMFFSSVLFPLSSLEGKMKYLILANPMTPIIETFRYGLLGKGEVNLMHIGYSVLITILLLIGGILLFNKTERTFNDTI